MHRHFAAAHTSGTSPPTWDLPDVLRPVRERTGWIETPARTSYFAIISHGTPMTSSAAMKIMPKMVPNCQNLLDGMYPLP